MDVQHQEKTAYEHRFPPKLIETEKPRFSVQCYRLLIRAYEAKQAVYWTSFRLGSGKKKK